MSRLRKSIAVAGGVVALAFAATPVAQAQALPGGSVSLPPIAPVSVPVPQGSSVGQLPPLPFPLYWEAPAPRFVASNWVVVGSHCPAAHQRAYSENGAQLWCTYLDLTDARLWAPHPTPVPWSPDVRMTPTTAVANSLGGKPCNNVGATAIDPSNGQAAHCDWRRIDSDVPVWQYTQGS